MAVFFSGSGERRGAAAARTMAFCESNACVLFLIQAIRLIRLCRALRDSAQIDVTGTMAPGDLI